jgi:signal transduction histidine kinase
MALSSDGNLMSLTSRRRWLLGLGLSAMMALLGGSALLSYKIQQEQSDQAASAYKAHIRQDEALQALRRTLWQSSVLVRDFLLSTGPERGATLSSALAERRAEADRALAVLAQDPIPGQDLTSIQGKLAEFWTTIGAAPVASQRLRRQELHDYVQAEVASRRRALSDLLQEITALSRISLEEGERRLDLTRRSAASRLAGMILLAMLLGMAFAVFSFRRMATLEGQTTRQYEEVSRTKTELQALSARLMSLQEAERARLSRELHDQIGQALATLRLELARIESAAHVELRDIRERLGRSRAILEEAVTLTRNISLMLRPSLLDDLGLCSAVQWLAEDFARRTGIACEVADNTADDSLPEDHRTCVFRIAQEALHNVEKHANARRVAISLRREGESITIAVDDDGQGMGASAGRAKEARLGILGMRERVLALAGSLDVGPSSRGGTRVVASLPLGAATAA